MKFLLLLTLLLSTLLPTIGCSENPQESGKLYSVESQSCIGCNSCIERCPHNAIAIIENKAVIDPVKCIGCGKCVTACPVDAIR